jgi:hypothetical protein
MPLTITVKAKELFDEANGKFINLGKDTELVLEHSLLSISKWESKYKKPFLDERKSMQTEEEILDYIRFMTISPQKPDPLIYLCLSKENVEDIIKYINDSQTATWFSNNKPQKPSRTALTNEVIYWQMIQYQIPVEFQKWHLNRLLTLLRVCDAKSGDPKKMSKRDIMARNSKLNAQRLAAMKHH